MQAPEMPVLPLRDIKLPPEPGFWPLAPGWWVLIALLSIVLLWVIFKWFGHLRKKRRWQEIDQQLSAIEFAFQQNGDKKQLLADLSVFLRRFVKFQLQQSHAVTLTGQKWIDHLNQLQEQKLFAPYATVLGDGVYQQNPDFDADGLLQATRQFIQHQVMNPPKETKAVKSEVQDV